MKFEELVQEIEDLDHSPAEVLPEAILTDQDWEEYYQEVERVRQASELAPGAGKIILKTTSHTK